MKTKKAMKRKKKLEKQRKVMTKGSRVLGGTSVDRTGKRGVMTTGRMTPGGTSVDRTGKREVMTTGCMALGGTSADRKEITGMAGVMTMGCMALGGTSVNTWMHLARIKKTEPGTKVMKKDSTTLSAATEPTIGKRTWTLKRARRRILMKPEVRTPRKEMRRRRNQIQTKKKKMNRMTRNGCREKKMKNPTKVIWTCQS